MLIDVWNLIKSYVPAKDKSIVANKFVDIIANTGLIEEDLDELFKLSHRLLVIFEGKIIKSFNTVDANINDIGLAMAGVSE